jgi:hypothetical protein
MTTSTIMRSVRVFLHSQARRAALVAGAVLLAACGTDDAPDPLEPTGPTGRIRFVNLITDPARNPVDVTLEGLPFGVNLAYTGTTPASLPAPSTAFYSPVLAGERTLVLLRTADQSVTVATLPVTVAADNDHTVFATGGAAGSTVAGFTVAEATPTIPNGQARIRVINMSPTGGAVDVFITAPNADLASATPAATDLAHQTASAGTNVAPGPYQIRTVPAGTAPAARGGAVNTSLTLTGTSALAAGAGRTIVIADAAAGGTPLRSFAISDQ